MRERGDAICRTEALDAPVGPAPAADGRRRQRSLLGRWVAVFCVAVAVVCAGAVASEARAASAAPLGLACADFTSDDGVRYRKCEGKVRSFDGLPLSTTVTLPEDARPPLPLVVLRHGSLGSKANFEAEPGQQLHLHAQNWNNVAFAKRGYAVLTSTARGWHDSCGPADRADPRFFAQECEGRRYWVSAMDPRWDGRDVQTQIGRLVDEGWVDPAAVGVFGYSMGGMEAWQLAMLNDRTMAEDGTLSPWRSPAGVPLRIAAAVPFAIFAEVVHGNLPNGRARDDVVPSLDELQRPFGVPNYRFMAPSCALWLSRGSYAPPGADPSADWAAWCARALVGNPFRDDAASDPVLVSAARELRFRAPLRFTPTWPRVPIFLWQGLTDHAATGIHGVMLFNRLRELDAGYPIKAWFDDIGHHPAAGTPAVYSRLHEAGHAFFDFHLRGKGEEPVYDVTAVSPACASDDGSTLTLRADRWAELSSDVVSFASDVDRVTGSDDGGAWGEGGGGTTETACPVNDPFLNGSQAVWHFDVEEPFVMARAPELTLRYTATGVDPQINARLWDLRPDGSRQKLLTRATYRQQGTFSATPLETTFQLWPRVWRVGEGHKLRLEITGHDYGFSQRNNTPFVLHIDSVGLRIPIAR